MIVALYAEYGVLATKHLICSIFDSHLPLKFIQSDCFTKPEKQPSTTQRDEAE